jgi:hypothetical protein
MERHIKILSVLHILYSLYMLAALSMVSLVFGVAHTVGGHIFSPFTTAYWPGREFIFNAVPFWIIAYLAPMAVAIPGMAGGIGLLSHRHWARPVLLVIGLLYLLDIPFGTALGVYTLWVLTQPEARRLLAT